MCCAPWGRKEELLLSNTFTYFCCDPPLPPDLEEKRNYKLLKEALKYLGDGVLRPQGAQHMTLVIWVFRTLTVPDLRR